MSKEPGPYEWIVADREPAVERRLCSELGVSTLVASQLVRRGIKDAEQGRRFLHPRLDDLHDPALLPDYGPATRLILSAREKGDLIYVHGDYDADGVTSTAIFARFLDKIGCKVVPHVPHRVREGYGISMEAVRHGIESGASLFLTCDCGISAFEQVQALKEAGLTVVVTDHHEPKPTLPAADAIVDPHLPSSEYPFEQLSGAGIAFKLCAGIARDLGYPVESFYRNYLDLATIGTVADVVPLVDENRTIVRHGLPQVFDSRRPGIRALLPLSLKEGADRVTTRDIGFGLGPRLNAVGRLDDASLAFDLLMTKDDAEARRIAKKLDDFNAQRKAEQTNLVESTIRQLEEAPQPLPPVLIVVGLDWSPGLIGLVAGKITEAYRRPSFVMTLDSETGVAKGSARSVPGFHLADALHEVSELILGGGGHALAAGFSVEKEKIEQLSKALNSLASQTIGEEPPPISLLIDAEVEADEADLESVEELALMEPYGESNPEPRWVTRNLRVESVAPTRNPDHANVRLRATSGAMRNAIGFGLGPRLAELSQGDLVDVVYTASPESYNGSRYVKWYLKDFALIG